MSNPAYGTPVVPGVATGRLVAYGSLAQQVIDNGNAPRLMSLPTADMAAGMAEINRTLVELRQRLSEAEKQSELWAAGAVSAAQAMGRIRRSFQS
jgi:hypothetical protein